MPTELRRAWPHGLAGAGAAGGGPYAGTVIGHQGSVPTGTATEIYRPIDEALGRMKLSEGVAYGLAARALSEPRHTLEYAMPPGHRYFSTFRARYRLDWVPQVTRWAFSLAPAGPAGGTCDTDVIPPPNYYRFATPGTP